MTSRQFALWILGFTMAAGCLWAEDGSRLWLRYDKISDSERFKHYEKSIKELIFPPSFSSDNVIGEELQRGLSGLLGKAIPVTNSISQNGAVVIVTPDSPKGVRGLMGAAKLKACGPQGYLIQSCRVDDRRVTVIAANTHTGVLYGVFYLLRLIQTAQPIDTLSIQQVPRIQRRLLNHWDNLDGSVERGYAGRSIWNWPQLPEKINPRIKDYARANASIGINGVVVNNVNTQAEILSQDYLRKAAVIAESLRPYGVRIYFSVKFTSPKEIGGLDSASPVWEC